MAVTDCIRQCRRCGASFVRTAKGQPTKYCSVSCREYREPALSVRKSCGCCGSGFYGTRLLGKYCSHSCRERTRHERRGPRLIQVTCRSCGDTVPKVRNSDLKAFCGRKCASRAWGKVRTETHLLARIAENWRRPSAVVHPRVRAETEALIRIAQYVEKPRLNLRPCMHCGSLAVGTLNRRRRCGQCKAIAAQLERRQRRLSPSGRADRRIRKASRRAVEHGVHADRIDPIKVFERDGWKCYLCECPTPRALRGKQQPNSPELEHVVPLSRGGTHTWGNVRCACRRCNGVKGSKLAA